MQPELPIPKIYEDDEILVLNKPTGLLSAPGRDPKVADLKTLLETKLKAQFFLVHRLDQDTSGILILAKDADSHRNLNFAFSNRKVKKVYLALSAKNPDSRLSAPPQWVDLPLLSKPDRKTHRVRVCLESGKPSQTSFKVLEKIQSTSFICRRKKKESPLFLIEAKPKTGRTHQIRAHLEATGFPILCDHLYGDYQAPLFLSENEPPLADRMLLHAFKLEVVHPKTGLLLLLKAPLPERFLRVFQGFGVQYSEASL